MKAIVCMNPMNGIGLNNTIPFHYTVYNHYFEDITIGKGNNAVVMGYNTFKMLGCKPLPNRRNYIITKNPRLLSLQHPVDAIFESNIENIIMLESIFDEVFVIGGETIFKLFEPYYKYILITVVDTYPIVDTFFNVNYSTFDKHLIKEIYENNSLLYFFMYNRPKIKN